MQDISGALEFKVLGPLEIFRNGEPLPLRSALQRRLLALLLAGSGQSVSVAVLIDSIWGGSPPDNARKSLLVYLHRLRRSLTEEQRIVRDPAGYRIRVTAKDFDACAFEEMATAARRARREGAIEQAADRFAAAMRLWRGEPYEDVPPAGPVAGEAHRLSEDRLLAQQELLEVRLDLGMHASLIGEIETLVRAHPFRERLSALRMLALYRSGRQAEALQVFRESRRVLGEEMGIDPGPLLQRVHDAILHHDERLESVATESIDGTWLPLREPPIKAGAPAAVVPRELPADVAGFAGRDCEMGDLEAARLGDAANGIPPTPVIVISGMAGVGKTASAVHWAHRITDDYPDGQLFLNLRGFSAVPALRPIEALTPMLRSLGVANDQVPAETEQAAARLRTETAGRRMLFLLDNAASAEQVAPLLPGSPGSLVIVTSRNQLGDLLARHGGFRLDQAPLAPDEAVALLKALLRVPRSEERPELRELAERCGYLPLALRIAAANLANRPHLGISGFTKRLSGGQMEALRIGDSPHTAMRATFDRSYTALQKEARGMFGLLGIAPVRSFSVGSAAALADVPAEVAERVVEQLVNAHMVIRDGDGRLHLHDLIRDYGNDLVDAADPARPEALARLFAWYVDLVDAACRCLYRGSARLLNAALPEDMPAMDDAEYAVRWLGEERDNLIAVARYSADHGQGSVAWRLADILRVHLWYQRDGAGLLAHGQAALRGALAHGSVPGEAVAELVLSAAHLSVRDYTGVIPHAERTTVLARQIGWEAGEASAHHTTSSALWQAGRLRSALEHGERALAINRANGRLRAQCTNLGMLGVIRGSMGALHQERALHAEALHLAEEIGDTGLQMTELNCLVQTSTDLGLLRSAEEHAARAIEIESGLGAGELSAATTESMSVLLSALGEYDSALAYAEASTRSGEERGDRRWTADGLVALAVTLNLLERHGDAVDAATRALDTAGTDLAEPRINALIERALGRIGLGELGGAEADAQRLLELAREGGFRIGEGMALNLEAELHLGRGRLERAAEVAGSALDVLRPSGHRAGAAWALWIRGTAARARGETCAARGFWHEVEQIHADMGAPVPKRFAMRLD